MKLSVSVLSTLVVAAVCLPGMAASDPGPSMSCAGTILYPGLGRFTFGCTAVTHQDGSVSGSWVLFSQPTATDVQVDIKCLHVEGNKATVGGVVRQGGWFGEDYTGLCMVAAAVDNGEGPDSPPDLVSGQFFDFCSNLPAETACASMVIHPPIPVFTGSVQVRP